MSVQRIFTFYFLLFIFSAHAQNNYPQNYFHSPLQIPLYLAGNFGEPRTDAFHMGLDLGTNGVEGLPVFASADGYVSRIKVSAFGYGNAIYITHPNGYMTVYGHLSKFTDSIAAWVKAQQYKQELFEVDLFPDSTMFRVKQGEQIANSGNTGRSGGPHLHFEIRDAAGETSPINPMLFGINISDNIKPSITSIEMTNMRHDFFSGTKNNFSVVGTNGNYSLTIKNLTVSSDSVFFGVHAFDYMQSGGANIGIYTIKVFLDSQEIYQFNMDRLEWENNRDANALINYYNKKLLNTDFFLTAKMPGDSNQIFSHLVNNGIIHLTDTLNHEVKILVGDFNENFSTLNFNIHRTMKHGYYSPLTAVKDFYFNQQNYFAADSIHLTFPQGVLYDNFGFQFEKSQKLSGNYSDVYSMGSYKIPIHDAFTLSILPYDIPDSLKTKAIIVYKNYKGNLVTKATQWKNGWLTSQVKDFGTYFVTTDLVAPVISCTNFTSGNKLSGKIIFKMTDALSGIKIYRGEVDGKWVLMEYDAKNDALSFKADSQISSGTHTLKLTVTDQVNNVKTMTITFVK